MFFKKIEEIKQLHFTNMQTQPWKPTWYKGQTKEHPRSDILNLFNNLRAEALQNGYQLKDIPKEKVEYKIQL